MTRNQQNAPFRRYSSIAVRMTKPPKNMLYNIYKRKRNLGQIPPLPHPYMGAVGSTA